MACARRFDLWAFPPHPAAAVSRRGVLLQWPHGLGLSHGDACMRAMDLEMRLTDGTRVPFLNAAVHAVLFYVSTMFPPLFLVSLVSATRDVSMICLPA